MSGVADEFVEALAPFEFNSPDLADYATAIGQMFVEVETYAADRADGTPGWAVMLDVDLCPAGGLPYLAQWVGERLPVGILEPDARQWIRDAPNQVRGTPYSIARAAQRYLTGTKVVQINERHKLDGTADVDWLAVRTFTSQTPSPSLVIAELRKVVPADIKLDFAVGTGATWASIQTTYGTWAAVAAALPDWAGVEGVTTGYISWVR